MLTSVRRAVADVATSCKRVGLQIQQLETQASMLDDQLRSAREAGREDIAAETAARQSAVAGQLADARAQFARVQADEERLATASMRLQGKVDAFRTREEAIKAAWTAAEATAEAARAEDAINEAIDDVISETSGPEAEAGLVPEAGPDAVPGREHVVPLALSELRPGAPELADERILFTVEAPGTAVLLAAGTADDWLRAWYAEAVVHSRARYQRGRTG